MGMGFTDLVAELLTRHGCSQLARYSRACSVTSAYKLAQAASNLCVSRAGAVEPGVKGSIVGSGLCASRLFPLIRWE